MTTPENPTPDKPAPHEPGTPEADAEGNQVDPQEALRGLDEQPRIDEQGYPTAYTAVPPPLGEQQQTPQEQQIPQAHANGHTPGPAPGQRPQANGQAQGQAPWQPPQEGGQAQRPPGYGQQPTGQADAHSPFDASYGQQARQQPPPPQQGAYAGTTAAGQQAAYGAQGQGGGQGPQDQPPPGYGYPPPPPGYESYGSSPYGEGHVPGMPPYASWGQRAGAWLIDNLVAVIGLSLLDASFYDWGRGVRVLFWIIAIAGVVWSVYNAYLAGQTGQSTGKRRLGIRLGRYVDGQVIGWPFGVLRLFMNAVFWAICFIPGVLNYLWPLWDQKSQTWSDKIASSVVVRAR